MATGVIRQDAELMFDDGAAINAVAKFHNVTYSTARVWWMGWRIAQLEKENAELKQRIERAAHPAA